MDWISVRDRMPEPGTNVLVYAVANEGDGHTINMTWRFQYTNGKTIWVEPYQFFLVNYHITHWMLLPEPPKEEPT